MRKKSIERNVRVWYANRFREYCNIREYNVMSIVSRLTNMITIHEEKERNCHRWRDR